VTFTLNMPPPYGTRTLITPNPRNSPINVIAELVNNVFSQDIWVQIQPPPMPPNTPYPSVSNEIKKLFSPSNAYWNKLGVISVNDGITPYLQVFLGPPQFSALPDFNIILNAAVKDRKLIALADSINSFNAKKRMSNAFDGSFSSVCGITSILLNHALDEVYIQNSSETYKYTTGGIMSEQNISPVFLHSAAGFNIGRAEYYALPLENYEGTYSKTLEATGDVNQDVHLKTAVQTKLFTNDIAKPVKKYFAVRNFLGAFYFELSNVGYIFSINVPSYTLEGSKFLDHPEWLIISAVNGSENISFDTYKVERVKSFCINQLRIEAHNNGLKFFNRNTQEKDDIGFPVTAFSQLRANQDYTKPPGSKNNSSDSDNKIEFTGFFGIYARELFFHLPMAIANLLAKSLQYDDARKWYHLVYNSLGADAGHVNEVWQYAPFHLYDKTKIKSIPVFDSDIIAENDLNVYMKWTLEQYVLFILDFADNEFMQETWESLSAATQLYFEVEDLLGQEPQMKDAVSEFENNAVNRIFSNAQQTNDYFGVPTNMNLKSLWERVRDRLYKLRNGLNINGEKQMPSMYGTAIDPARLLLASQYGGINPYDSSSLSVNNSVYRFRELAPHTESIINLVVEFGGQLLSALAQKDNEQLQALQATHQVNMLNVVNNMYQYQIDEAAKEIDILTANLATVQAQLNYYQSLIDKGLLPAEIGGITANAVAAELQNSAAAVRTGAIVGHLVPTVFGLADGDLQPGSAIDSLATILNETGQSAQTIAQVLSAQAEYARRAEEWQFQQDQAQSNIDQINENINAANIRLSITRENMKQYQLSVNQANEVLNYLTNKFTNADLYTWMSGQMTSLYFTAYQLALSSLHSLQNAYQYELDDTAGFIPGNSWNSLQKGLLAGETLKLALARLQDAYITNNVRRLEIEQIFSLKEVAYNWNDFKNKTSDLKFNIGASPKTDSAQPPKFAALFGDYTYYKIKTVDISIPAVIGPYETFNATLTQTAATVNKNENQTALSKNNKIIISRGINDNGVFTMSENDGRYLPFEGNGAISSWTLNMSPALVDNISDIIFTIKFNVK
ncbi:MAG TPA: hypothetical protein PL045_01140, partial [Chitinophagaceae bacterium]|nr:hypothetical protein [Chitinophagaceae bacterium]